MIVILTGAGISAESGLATFRDLGGIWSQVRLEEVATPEAFRADPERVQAFYNARRAQAAQATPNAAHVALGHLQAALDDDLLLVTQNVDDLHERGGAKAVHMHGSLFSALCGECGAREPWQGELGNGERCAACGLETLRPDVVWFGEMPYHMERIEAALQKAELFVSIGTSGQVYPAAGFAALARDCGADTLELNLEATGGAFDRVETGRATEIVPLWVQKTLGRQVSD
ncbi:NAD-dependent deacylase [Algicella marina]|uniref:NAD-dependent protein deacylase n=1 Tax=Algicella marina TaxID=2683284 RepID=A0A6P1T3I8_9RHOB|nr:NAD-dependent deacylase [Algicella marina]QHQ37298.1 NAD-dependent protein deacylase [Algicella marina]